ncbi:MAG: lipopolysaccharide biosynthesis protein [Pedobacter sp.]|nr:MAG: lipopolysaccharide biosynthesis protein [Pedobacter sp.]
MIRNVEDADKRQDEISVKELIMKLRGWWKYILSKLPVVMVFVLIGVVLGFLYATFKKSIYTATTTFVLQDESAGSGGLGTLAGLASVAGVDIGGSGNGMFQAENILELYKSRKMLSQTLLSTAIIQGKKQTLVERYIDFNHLREKWVENPNLARLKFDVIDTTSANRPRDSILTTIIDDLSKNYVAIDKADKKVSIIKVDVKSADEFFAKAFNEALVKTVNDFYIQTKTKKAQQNVQILQAKSDSIRSVMNGAIYRSVEISDATPNWNPTRQVQKVAPAQKAQISVETNKAILGSLIQNLELAKLSLLKETPLLEVIDYPIYPLNVNKFSRIKGMVFGGILFGISSVIFLLFRKFIKNIMA